MPIIRIDLLEGRSDERKRALIRNVTAAVVESLGVAPEQVRVLVSEYAPDDWAVGGVSFAERAATIPPPDQTPET